MSRRPRGTHAPALKATVALAAVKGEGTLAELLKRTNAHPAPVTAWKDQPLVGATRLLANGAHPVEPPLDVKTPHVNVGALALENDSLKRALGHADPQSARRSDLPSRGVHSTAQDARKKRAGCASLARRLSRMRAFREQVCVKVTERLRLGMA